MPSSETVLDKAVRGRVRPHRVKPGGRPVYDRARRLWLPPGFAPASAWKHNQVQYDWGFSIAKLAAGDLAYAPRTLYIEFANLADPDDTVDPPSFARSHEEGVDYYLDLRDSSDRDYLRIDVIAPQVRSSDEAVYPLGNQLVLYGVATVNTGVGGKSFAPGSNSKAYGGALVASPVADDPTRDVVLARAYFAADAQQIALATSQIGIEWEWTFT